MPTSLREPEDIEALKRELQAAGKLAPITDAQKDGPLIRRIEDIPSVFDCATEHRAFVVAGFLPEASVTMLTSESGDGKTMLALNIAACISKGITFCGKATTQRPVLYLDKENPAHVVAERLRLFGVSDSESLRVWGCWCVEEPAAADSPIVLEWVLATEPKPLIVVDSLIAYHPGAENDSAETRRYMHGYRRLASLGATVVLLHHSGKAETSKEYRGSSDIKAAIDCGYHLANLSGDRSRLELVRLRAFKTRFPVDTELVLRFGQEGFEECERSERPTMTDTLIELLKAHPRIRTAEFETLAVYSGLSRQRAREFLKNESVRIDKGENNARYHTWTETDSFE